MAESSELTLFFLLNEHILNNFNDRYGEGLMAVSVNGDTSRMGMYLTEV
jgi:hypothetical protein